MESTLPETLIPRRAAQRALVLNGTLDPSLVPRLVEAFEITAPILVILRFNQIDEDRVLLTGALETAVIRTCQRCLERFETALHAEVDVEFSASPTANEADREVVASPEQALDIAAFVEDELLLSAPMVAVHPPTACSAPGAHEEIEQDAVTTRRPFLELGNLLNRT